MRLTWTANYENTSIKKSHCTKNEVSIKLRIWSHLLKKSLMENLIFCAVIITLTDLLSKLWVAVKKFVFLERPK